MTAATAAPSFFSDSDVTNKMFPSVAETRFIIAIPTVVFPLPLSPTRPHCLAGRDNERNIGDGLDMTDCSA
jgi:hypothetical protein